ncbi:hypothetical protein ACFLSG_03960 [Candidatus Bipolaricaulota bacterium]
MRKLRILAVLLSLVCILSFVAAQQGISLHFSGRLSAGEGSCQQVSESQLTCQIAAGSSGLLDLEATVTPAGHIATIEGWGLPPWVDFVPTSGPGTVSTSAGIHPPVSAAGQTVWLLFSATTDNDLVVDLEVQLEITSDKPHEDVPGGDETDQGTEFETPFLPDVSTFVLGDVLDCVTGEIVDPTLLSTEFVFAPGSEPPYELSQLEKVIVRAFGYLPYQIIGFQPYTINLLFIQITLLMPAETGICLDPIGDVSLVPIAPIGDCVGEVTTLISESQTPFQWEAVGNFLSYEILVYDNPCGLYPPPPTPTPSPTPTPTPTGTPSPTPTPTAGQPKTTTAGVWEPLWERLTPEQREQLEGRGLSGWGWVKAARELLGESGEPVPAEGLIEEVDGVLLPDTSLIARFGPISGETMETILPLEGILEPGAAFIWQILGVYEDAEGEQGAILTPAQCVRYQPVDILSGDVVPVASCPECESVGDVWDCDQPIQVTKPLDYYPKTTTMNPDERISLSILGTDTDLLLWQCECLEETMRKIGIYPDRLSYNWQLTGKGQLVDTFENSAIYELPVDLEPNEQTTATIRITLNAPRGGDESIEGRVILTITAGAEGCGDYSVQTTIIQPTQEPCPPPLLEYGRDCLAFLKYGKADGPISGTILLYTMAYVGEPILLKATHTDNDELTIKCEQTICIEPPEIDYSLQDPLAFTWDDQGAGGQFPLGNTGRGVVYIPPRKDNVTIQCTPQDLIVRDPDARKTDTQPVAQIVIDLTMSDSDWLPEKDNTTTFTARIYEYRNGQCTYPGPQRRITFDLSDISNELGYCVNQGDSQENDLFFSRGLLQGTFHLCNDETRAAAQPTYFTQATTKARATEMTVTVSSGDYGSYGELDSSAFNAQAIKPRAPNGAVVCQLGDNTVDIPRDDVPQGGNHIADAWDARYPNNQAETNDQDESVNNPSDGDGLTRYQEYRGVDVNDDGQVAYNDARTAQQELRAPQNERLSPEHKDLFITTVKAADLANLRYGRAYENASIVVHKFQGSNRRGIDVLSIDITAGTPTGQHFTASPARSRTDLDGHLNKIETPNNSPVNQARSWTTDWMGGSTIGNMTTYGNPLLFSTSIDNYFSEFPYIDGGTFQPAAAGAANPNTWAGNANGTLDTREMVEDRNDNGHLDPSEQDNNFDDGDNVLDGDRLRFAYAPGTGGAFISGDWNAGAANPGAFNVYNRNGDAQVEAPDGSYTRQQVDVMIITHELGHALGVGSGNTLWYNLRRLIGGGLAVFDGAGHCSDPRCTMFRETNNFTRQDFLCPNCQAVLLIHNN